MVAVFLDPGRNLGVLRAPLREKMAIVHGVNLTTVKLRDVTDLGAWLCSADAHLAEWIMPGVSEVWCEAPNTDGQNHWAVRKNCALMGHIAHYAARCGIPFRTWNVMDAKVALCDRGNAKKVDMMTAAEFQLGLSAGTLSEHEADTFAGWLIASWGVQLSPTKRAAQAAAKRREAKAALKAAALT